MGRNIYKNDTEPLYRYYFYLLFSFTMMMPETVKLFIFLFVIIFVCYVTLKFHLFSYPCIRTQYLNKFYDFLMPCCLLWCHANGIKFKDCCYRHMSYMWEYVWRTCIVRDTELFTFYIYVLFASLPTSRLSLMAIIIVCMYILAKFENKFFYIVSIQRNEKLVKIRI